MSNGKRLKPPPVAPDLALTTAADPLDPPAPRPAPAAPDATVHVHTSLDLGPTLLGREPVFYMAVIQAALGLVLAFGFSLSATQVTEILVLSAAVLGWITRQHVTPVEAPNLPGGTEGGGASQ